MRNSYNSAVYPSISVNSYNVFVVSEAFLDDPQCQNCTSGATSQDNSNPSGGDLLRAIWQKSREGALQKLEPSECINAYGVMTQSTRRNLLAVVANENIRSGLPDMAYPPTSTLTHNNNTNLYEVMSSSAAQGLAHYRYSGTPFDWICSGLVQAPDTLCLDRLADIKSSPQPWNMSRGCFSRLEGYCDRYVYPIDYCLSETADPRCRLHFNTVIAVIVTVLNFCRCQQICHTEYHSRSIHRRVTKLTFTSSQGNFDVLHCVLYARESAYDYG